jgi:hypothetical protein
VKNQLLLWQEQSVGVLMAGAFYQGMAATTIGRFGQVETSGLSVRPRAFLARIQSRRRTFPVFLSAIENEKVLGIVSIGDLVKWIISAHEETIYQLHHYIAGSYPA